VLVIVALVIAIAAAALVGVYARRQSHSPPELPENWWPEFERAFRAYVHRTPTRTNTKE